MVIISDNGGDNDDNDNNKSVSIMTTNYLKTGVESTPETPCLSNIPQTVDNFQQNVPIMST
jgi:hypothetical protein